MTLPIVLVGMRYGSIDEESGKSYTELEFEEAIKNKIPVLAFVIDENECPVLPKFVDVGDRAKKLENFKKRLDRQMTSRFKSVDDLKQLVIRSVDAQIKRVEELKLEEKKNEIDDYIEGARLYRRFLLLPERYKDQEAILRIRMDGVFSSWRLREELFLAFNIKAGDAVFGNDAVVFGIELDDIEDGAQKIDFFAEGKNADWILDNNVTQGTVFEGKFRFAYETVEAIAQRVRGDVDAKIAALVLVEGIQVIAQEKVKKVNKLLT